MTTQMSLAKMRHTIMHEPSGSRRSNERLAVLLLVVALFGILLAGTARAQDVDKSGVKPQVINLPSGPGSIQGLGEGFEPQLNSGTAGYAIPFVLPPGTGGFAPSLQLVYEGGRGNGEFGLGWRLDLPYVQRQTDKGLPAYVDLDPFVHSSGEELVPLGNGVFRFKVEKDFSRFQFDGTQWIMTERNGTRWFLGETSNGRQQNARGTFRWLPQRIVDTNDNEIRLFYIEDQGYLYLQSIRYSVDRSVPFGDEAPTHGIQIDFSYAQRPDPLIDYRSRARVQIAQRTQSMAVHVLGKHIRTYEFDYNNDNSVSLLSEVRMLGREMIRWEDDPSRGLPALTLGYTEFHAAAGQNVSMRQPPLLAINNPNVDLVDINGDALPDLVYTDPGTSHRFYLNRGRGRWVDAAIFPSESPGVALSSNNVQLADADGDGFTDLLVKAGAAPGAAFSYYPNRGGNAWEFADRVDFVQSPSYSYDDPNVWLIDTDNDQRIDVVRTTSSAYYIYFNRDGGWSSGPDRITEPVSFGGPLLAEDPRTKLADMNGDGLQDIVLIQDERVVYVAAMGMGDYDEDNTVIMAGSPSLPTDVDRIFLSDINGDGLADLLQVDRYRVSVWLNQAATGYGSEIVLTDVPEYIAGETALRLADMNGDGATDLLYSTYPAAEADTFRYLSFVGGVLPNLLTTIDNGLGRVIGLEYRASTEYYVDDWDAGAQWTQRSPVPVSVVSRSTVTDKHSGQVYTTEYAYRNAYYDGGDRAFRGFALAQQTDIGDTSAPTLVQQYIFDTGMLDESRKGMILQHDMIEENGSCGMDGPLVAVMLATASTPEIAAADSHQMRVRPAVQNATDCYQRTENALATRTLAAGIDDRNVTFSFVQATDTYHYERTDSPRRTRQEVDFDDYGNETTLLEYGEIGLLDAGPAVGNDERLTFTEYIIDEERWIVDRPHTVRLTDLADNVVSHRRFYYDGPAFQGLPLGRLERGNLIREEAHLGPNGEDRWVQTQRNKYDSFGNRIALMDANGRLSNGVPNDEGHWTELQYDEQVHAYPVAETIYIGDGRTLQMTAIYDPGFGVMTSATNFNGYTTEFVYDDLGRVTSVVRPGDTHEYPSQVYQYHAGSQMSWVVTDLREVSGTTDVYRSVTYVDGLARTLQTRSEGEDGQVVVENAVTYNRRGEVYATFLPYYDDGDLLQYTSPSVDQPQLQAEYDATLRAVSIINPDETFTRTIYLPLKQVHYDEEDNRPDSSHFDTPKTLGYDGLERLVAVEERNRGDVYTTRYAYDPLDNLTRIADAQNNIKTQVLDGLSRKIRMDDPNSGVRLYGYDDVGNLTETLDAKGQRVVYAYDGVNRVVSENFVATPGDNQLEIQYHYDENVSTDYPDAKNTLGLLAWVQDTSGAEFFSYDARGNIAGRIKRIVPPDGDDVLDFVFLYEYDAMDRQTKMAYPDGSEQTYLYDDAAMLSAIPGWVQEINYAPFGRRSRIETANGVITNHTYDARQRLVGLKSTHSSGDVLQEWVYTFDGASNIVRIDDLRPDRTADDEDTRIFELDDLYRLSGVNYLAGNQDTIDYEYDAVGNLTRKTSSVVELNLGDLQYGQNAGPHALTQVGVAVWQYDANGNLTTKPGVGYVWNYRDRLTGVTGEDGLSQAHRFDYSGRRVVKHLVFADRTLTVLYPDQMVEIRNGQFVRYVMAENERLAEIRSPFRRDKLLLGFEGNVPATDPLLGFDRDGDSWLTLTEIAGRGGEKNIVELDEIDDVLGIFFENAALPHEPVMFETVTDAVRNYRLHELQLQPTQILYYVSDHLGSSSVFTDQAGKVIERLKYYPFGAERTARSERGSVYRYIGQELDDETELYNVETRLYDPIIGRFISADQYAIQHIENIRGKPQASNTYSYAFNSPISFYDPDGRMGKKASDKKNAKADIGEVFMAGMSAVFAAGELLVGGVAIAESGGLATPMAFLLMEKGAADLAIASTNLWRATHGEDPLPFSNSSEFFTLGIFAEGMGVDQKTSRLLALLPELLSGRAGMPHPKGTGAHEMANAISRGAAANTTIGTISSGSHADPKGSVRLDTGGMMRKGNGP